MKLRADLFFPLRLTPRKYPTGGTIFMEQNMFCYQCQETAGCSGCTKSGVCGKRPETAALQDLLIWTTKGLSAVTTQLRREEKTVDASVNHLITENLFTTITNVNFDDDTIRARIEATLETKALLAQLADCSALPEAALWNGTTDEFAAKAVTVGVLSTENEDIRSLRELITYGLKGLAAYTSHANVLLKENEEIDAFLQRALAATLDDSLSAEELTALALETGSYGVQGMALLDEANTSAYGNPEITTVDLSVGTRPGILVSGHDLRDLEMLLEQTVNTGIDVYTHSEMLPAHYYPAFKKYEHFKGNYGNAWWKQKEEFEAFNGPILMTTNCIVPPKDSYKNRIYTTGAVRYPGCPHIDGVIGETKDFSLLIEQAKHCAPPTELEQGTIVGGFAHAQVLALADQIVDAVKSGAIKKFVVMAGCDGRAKSRSYYSDFAQALPKDTVILTAGCAKYKYNKLNLGDINGIPRVLDAGQCNDSYSLAVIALKLKEVFGLDDINDLPIIYNISWYEQKAVIVLLALLSLGVKNIHLGPTLPAFLSSNVAALLVENFGIAGIDTVENDMELFFGK
jgi:hydroxylamine reductase